MATIKASIDVDVPLEFADLEWSEFVFKSLFSGYTRGLTDVEPLIDEDDLGAGKVDFTTAGDRLVKVNVELDYAPHGGDDRRRRGRARAGHPRARPREVPPLRARPLREAAVPDERVRRATRP